MIQFCVISLIVTRLMTISSKIFALERVSNSGYCPMPIPSGACWDWSIILCVILLALVSFMRMSNLNDPLSYV